MDDGPSRREFLGLLTLGLATGLPGCPATERPLLGFDDLSQVEWSDADGGRTFDHPRVDCSAASELVVSAGPDATPPAWRELG